MSDIRDMLGIPETPPVQQKKQTPSRKQRKQTPSKKHDLSRELRALTNGKPPITPTTPIQVFKEKRKIGPSTTGTKWVWAPFSNSARTDGFKLYHWSRVEDVNDDYPFAKLDKKIKVFQYTNEEYEQHLKNLDPRWTKEMTDELFELCKLFDLKFIVIQDRFSHKMTVEDIKQRYYSVAKVLLHVRAKGNLAAIRDHPLMKLNFDYEYERRRKMYMENLFRKDQATVQREEELRKKLKQIEQIKKKRSEEERKERNRQRKKEREEQLRQQAELEKQMITPPQPIIKIDETPQQNPLLLCPGLKDAVSGVYARSNLMMAPVSTNTKLARRVDMILEELQVGIRPMPTATIHQNFEFLRKKIVYLVELQKKVSRKEYGLQLLIGKKEELMKKQGIKVESSTKKTKKKSPNSQKKRSSSSTDLGSPQTQKRKKK